MKAPLRIILAESDPVEVDWISSNIDLEFRGRAEHINNYVELIKAITEEKPQLLILGNIRNTNYFQICRECHKIWEDISIILASKQSIINDEFLEVAKRYGVIDIIDDDFTGLNNLLQALNFGVTLTGSLAVNDGFTSEFMLNQLNEIVGVSKNYFGDLALGNYWRKSHAQIVDEFPFLLKWSADHFGKISCDASILKQDLTGEEINILRIWVQYFIKECDRTIIDFGMVLNDSQLLPSTKDLLIRPS
jgi:hypothetical protein